MLLHRGTGRHSVLTGRSVHNQRIERFWRDLREGIIDFYKNLFGTLENDYYIDFDDPVMIFCLHYLFLPRINQDLKEYIEIWNSHKIRTAGNHTPYQLLLLNTDRSAALDIPEDHMIEGDQEGDEYEDDYEQVVLPPINSPLCPEFYNAFRHYFQLFNLTVKNTNDMIAIFRDAINYFQQLISLQQQQQHFIH